jgi:subtilisin family serine protease
MANYKVIVPLLNKRKYPVENTADKSNIVGQVKKDFQFESMGEKTISSGTWYMDRDGYYYWSGGLVNENTLNNEDLLNVDIHFQKTISKYFDGINFNGIIDYNKLLNFPDEYKKSLGKGITIALMDTGIFHHPILKDAIEPYEFDFTNSRIKQSDINGHGTFLSGLIGGQSLGLQTMYGIAPKCNIANLKVIKDNGSAVGKYLELGLNKVADLYSNAIINMSLSISAQEYSTFFEDKVFETFAEKHVCVAAAGENTQLLSDKGIYSPANSEKVIAVGTIDEDFLSNNPKPTFDSRLDFIIPQFDLVSCSLENGYIIEPGLSSMACAIVSAIIAIIFSTKGPDTYPLKSQSKNLIFWQHHMMK